MRFIEIVKNAVKLLLLGEWREFEFRLRILLGQIDLGFSSQEALNLPAERCYDYADSGGLHLEKILRELRITARDGIVDFGSGKGGALFTFSKYPFRRITGCEISAELVAIAKQNLQLMRVDNVDFVVGDAAELTALDDYTFFYFFNPFPENVMREVVANIAASLEQRPRKATLIYFNPECHEIIISGTPFKKVKEYPQNALRYFVYTNQLLTG